MLKRIKNIIYGAVDMVTFGKGIPRTINGFRILFPPKWFRYFESDYESANVAFLKTNCKEGMRVMDIGAHIGLLSVTAGQLAGPSGKVYAFEPAGSRHVSRAAAGCSPEPHDGYHSLLQ
jgi:hypothetical protein